MRIALLIAIQLSWHVNASAACSSGGARGAVQYNSGSLQLCDGSTWIDLNYTGNYGACSDSGRFSYTTAAPEGFRYCRAGTEVGLDSGTAAGTCSGQSGKIEFDDSLGQIKVCNAGTWKVLADGANGDPCAVANPPVGTVCGDGTIFVGIFKLSSDTSDYKYYVTPSDCTNSSTPTCDGTVDSLAKVWYGAALDLGTVENISSATTRSLQSGEVATPEIPNGDNAATYCSAMSYGSGGPGAWFLPSKSEMAFLYCNSATTHANKPEEDPNCTDYDDYKVIYGGTVASAFSTSLTYATTNEASATNIWTISFGTGMQFAGAGQGKTTTRLFRCMRRVAVP